MPQSVETSAPIVCADCGETYELCSFTKGRGQDPHSEGEGVSNDLPWMVVKDFDKVRSVSDAVAHATCQRCLDWGGHKDHGLRAKLEELGVQVVQTGTAPQFFHGVQLQTPRVPGFQPTVAVSLSGAPGTFPGAPPIALPGAPPGGPIPAPAVPVMGPSGPAPAVAIAMDGVQLVDRAPRVFHDRRASTVTLGDALRSGGVHVKDLKKALPKNAQDAQTRKKQQRFDKRLAALGKLVAALKRSRKTEVIERLLVLAEQLHSTARTDPKRRSNDEILELSGAKPGWLSGRFTKHLAPELFAQVQAGEQLPLTLETGPICTVIELLGLTAEQVRDQLAELVAEDVQPLIARIRKGADHTRLSVLADQIIGWATYISILRQQSREEVLEDLGTSELELEYMLFNSSDPDPDKGQAEESEHDQIKVTTDMRELAIKTESGEQQVQVFTRRRVGTLSTPPAPLPKVPAGTSGEGILPAPVAKIQYPEGEQYGPRPMFVIQGISHVREFTLEGDEGSQVVSVMGDGMLMQMSMEEPVSGLPCWVYRPLLSDGDVLEIAFGHSRSGFIPVSDLVDHTRSVGYLLDLASILGSAFEQVPEDAELSEVVPLPFQISLGVLLGVFDDEDEVEPASLPVSSESPQAHA